LNILVILILTKNQIVLINNNNIIINNKFKKLICKVNRKLKIFVVLFWIKISNKIYKFNKNKMIKIQIKHYSIFQKQTN